MRLPLFISTKVKNCLALGCILITISSLKAQQVNGYWKGTIYFNSASCYPKLNIEIQILQIGNKITGNTYYYPDTTTYIKEEFEGEFNTATGKLEIKGTKLEVKNIPSNCTACIRDYVLEYIKKDSSEVLSGSFIGKSNLNLFIKCPDGNVVLTRKFTSDFKNTKLQKMIERKNTISQTIEVDTGRIEISLYDNGQIDGDIISLFEDNKPILQQQVLTKTPIEAVVNMSAQSKEKHIAMVGENHGTIPPNTAVMIVKTKTKRHVLHLSSDDKHNATVKLVLKP